MRTPPKSRLSEPDWTPLQGQRELEAAALNHLDRFACTEHTLRRYLLGWLKRRGGARFAADFASQIDSLMVRYRASGLLNDARYAETAVDRLAHRGTSERAIQAKLQTRGFSSHDVDGVLGRRKAENPQAELQAAQALVRRRRLGLHRAPELRKAYHRKDLAILARAGFDFDLACRALAAEDSDCSDAGDAESR